jgi:hypothetical protein
MAIFNVYLTTTITPMMLGEHTSTITIREISEDAFTSIINSGENIIMAVGHEHTARLLEQKYGIKDAFSRLNLQLRNDDYVIAAVPQIRFDKAREFSLEEITKARFRFFEGIVGADPLRGAFDTQK